MTKLPAVRRFKATPQRSERQSDPNAPRLGAWTNPPSISARNGARGNPEFGLCYNVMLGHADAKQHRRSCVFKSTWGA